jgi:hypothetical protein
VQLHRRLLIFGVIYYGDVKMIITQEYILPVFEYSRVMNDEFIRIANNLDLEVKQTSRYIDGTVKNIAELTGDSNKIVYFNALYTCYLTNILVAERCLPHE